MSCKISNKNLALFLVTLSFILILVSGVIAVSVTKNAGTGSSVTGVGTIAWSNSGYITTVGSPYATAVDVPSQGGITRYLQGTNYSFSIPSGSTINGIMVTINKNSSGSQSPFLRDNVVKLIKGGAIVGNNKAVTGVDWTTGSLATTTYGSSTDLWGVTTWTPADINNANFGVALSAINSNTNYNRDRTATVDYMQITVYYTVTVYGCTDSTAFN
jgi:hypothetical protein